VPLLIRPETGLERILKFDAPRLFIYSRGAPQSETSPQLKGGGHMRKVLFVTFFCLAASSAFAQDPVTVDPKHYKVMLDNDQVRVLKIQYGAKEKSVM